MRTAKLFRDGVQKMTKKLVEEAIEVGLDAVQMNRELVVLESADMLYHLAVIWAECGVTPGEVMSEIDRRERTYGIAEKLPQERRSGADPPDERVRPAPEEPSPALPFGRPIFPSQRLQHHRILRPVHGKRGAPVT